MEWLQEIFDRLMSIFPRIMMLPPYEAGIRMTLGKHIKVLTPGWYLYWPLIQELITMEVQTQVADIRTQSVRTADDKDIIVSGTIQYRINDIEKAICNVQDVDEALANLTLGIILDFVNKKTMSDLQNVESLKSELRKGMAEACSGWGVKIERVFITDLGHTRNIRLLMNPKS